MRLKSFGDTQSACKRICQKKQSNNPNRNAGKDHAGVLRHENALLYKENDWRVGIVLLSLDQKQTILETTVACIRE